ncbi:MAG: hypothetical protein ABRQ27_12970 [Clostridiaceae bacterium]
MRHKKYKSRLAPVLLALLGAALMAYGAFNCFLSIAGKNTTASIASSTYFHKSKNTPNTYTYNVSYRFQVDGKSYTGSGYITKKMYGGPTGSLSIKYFPFVPSMNAPAKSMEGNIWGMFLGGGFLLVLDIAIIKQERRKRKRKEENYERQQ